MADNVNKIWMNVWDKLIRESFAQALVQGGQDGFLEIFEQSAGGYISRSLPDSFQTPLGVYLYYPSEDGLVPTIIYTPKVFQTGSSITHFDSGTYRGSLEYLMRPSAQPGAGVDSFVPGNKNGPLGKDILGVLRSMGYAIYKKRE
jgi:hypothetical protein